MIDTVCDELDAAFSGGNAAVDVRPIESSGVDGCAWCAFNVKDQRDITTENEGIVLSEKTDRVRIIDISKVRGRREKTIHVNICIRAERNAIGINHPDLPTRRQNTINRRSVDGSTCDPVDSDVRCGLVKVHALIVRDIHVVPMDNETIAGLRDINRQGPSRRSSISHDHRGVSGS